MSLATACLSSERSDWETPAALYRDLDAEFRFTLDPCATRRTAKCTHFYTRRDNGLTQSWRGERVFMNPPYGRDIARWIRKASESGALVVGLVPARTDTIWWHGYVIDAKAEVRFLRGRLRFALGTGRTGRAPFPSAIVIWRGDAPLLSKRGSSMATSAKRYHVRVTRKTDGAVLVDAIEEDAHGSPCSAAWRVLHRADLLSAPISDTDLDVREVEDDADVP